ncbi:MAG: hypothetical protein ACT4P5_16390 [Armatimonadota bacterium]
MRIFAKTLAVCGLAIAVLAVGVVPSRAQFPLPQPQQPAQPAPQPPAPYAPQPAADPRVERVKAALQQKGLRVYGVAFHPVGRNNNVPIWFVQTAANYAQPSHGAVLQQAFDIWGIVYSVVAQQDPPQTGMVGVQIWTKYGIGMSVQAGVYAELLSRLQASSTQADKGQAFNNFTQRIQFVVIDLERNQRVDSQDFMNKNFTR